MKYYAVIDTNVLVSALITHNDDAATVKVLEYLFSGIIVGVFNKEIIDEYSDVLHRKRFALPEVLINKIIKAILTGIYTEGISVEGNFPDKKDIVFYQVALSKDDAYLVTGNTKHFPKVNIVVTPAEMIGIIEREKNANRQ